MRIAWPVVVVFVALAALGPVTDAHAQSEPIKVGILTSLTTEFAGVGIRTKNGAEMAFEEINARGGIRGRKIEMIVADTANSNTVAVNAFLRVAAEKPIGMIGPIWGTQNLALSPAVKKEQVPFMYSAGTVKVSKQGNEWMFGVSPSDEIAARAMARFIAERLRAKRVAIQYVNNEYGTGSSALLADALQKEHGIADVWRESHAATDKDMSAQILNHRAKNPDVLVVWGHPADTAVIMRQGRQLGLKAAYLGPTAPVLPATLNLVSDEDAEGWYGEVTAWVNDNPDPNVTAWVERYKKRFNIEPDFIDAVNYDAANILAGAIDRALGQDARDLQALRDAVRKELAGTEYQGLGTHYKFDAEGRGPHGFWIVQIQKGKKLKAIERVDVPVK